MDRIVAAVAAVTATFVIATAARAGERCSKEMECKGNRICVQRQCSDPPKDPAGPERGDSARAQAPSEPVAGSATQSLPNRGNRVVALPLTANVPPISSLPPPVPGDAAVQAGYHPAPEPQRTPQPEAPASRSDLLGARHRHSGAFFRPDISLGYLATSWSRNTTDFSLTGFGAGLGIAGGFSVAANHVLALQLWDAVSSSPNLSVNGTSKTFSGSFAIVGIGLSYTAYSHSNLYFTISPSLTKLTVTVGSTSNDSQWGYGFRSAVGKEWWLSDVWGLGAAAQFSFNANDDTGTNAATFTTWSTTFGLTVTYN